MLGVWNPGMAELIASEYVTQDLGDADEQVRSDAADAVWEIAAIVCPGAFPPAGQDHPWDRCLVARYCGHTDPHRRESTAAARFGRCSSPVARRAVSPVSYDAKHDCQGTQPGTQAGTQG